MKKTSILTLALVGILACAASAQAATATMTFGDVKVHTVTSESFGNAVVVEHDKLVIFDAFGNEADDAQFKAFIDSLNKPVERVFLSHSHDHHWKGIDKLLPGVEIFSVDAEAINKTDSTMTAKQIPDGKLSVDGVVYDFVTYGDIGAWVIKMPEQKVALVHHLGYVGVHVPMPPMDVRLGILKSLEADGYTWFIGGHGIAMEASKFNTEVAAYFDVVGAAVAASKTPEEAKVIIVGKYPQWGGDQLLDMILPMFYQAK